MKTTICLSCALSITFLTLLSTCQGQKFTVTPSGTYYVTRSKPVTLECEAENVDNMQYACSKEMHDSQLTVAGRVSDDGTETLKASLKVTKADIQGYSSRSPFWCECVGDTDSGNPIRSRRSEIKSAFLKKEFKTVPKSKSAPIGSKVEFSCEGPAGQPFPMISWHKNGKKVNTQKDKNFIVNDRGMLIIRRLRQKDLGEYTCIARNIAAKRVSSPATLTIGDVVETVNDFGLYSVSSFLSDASVEDRLEASDAPLEDGPVFEKYPESLYYATKKKPAELTCRVVGANILTVRCNSRRLLDTEQTKQEMPSAQGKIMETTWPVTTDDIRRYGIDGSYSCYCVAWYALPGASGWLNRTSSVGYIELAFLDDNFAAQPQSQTVGIDSSVTFSCSAPRSKPPAEIRWFFNGQPLDMNSGIYVFDETSGSLTLESVTLRDNGEYQCAASNVAGVKYSDIATLTVQDGFVRKVEPTQATGRRQTIPVATVAPTTPARAPGEAYFSTPLEDVYYMTQDKPAKITCGVKNADMITFRCNRRRYEQDEITKDQVYNQESNKYDITSFIQVTAQDVAKANGEYSCICTMWYTVGGNWERTESVEAKVEEAFLEEEFAMEPVDSEVRVGVAAELVCSPPFGGPEPEVSWLRDNERVDTTRDGNVEITVDGSLSILSMRKKYEGSYTCVASNAAGVLYSRPARLTALARTETVTDAITESILVDVSSTAEPLDYTPYSEPEISSEPGRGTAHGSSPMFLEEPKTTYYVVKGQFITITCQAKNVIRIAFRCSGMTVPNYRYDNNQVSSSDMMSVSLELSREDVEGFTDDNSCVCDAFYYNQDTQEEDKITSSPGFINMAYIKKRFQKNPVDLSTMEGMMAALPCTPPEALPRPTVHWLFNGKRLDSKLGTNIVQPDDNSLVFVNPTQDLAGDYTCVAENVAGKRTSNTARLTVEVPRGGGGVVFPETTSEPIGEPEIATSEPEPEPEGEVGYTTHGDDMHHGHGQHGGHAYPKTTEGYFVTSMRGNEIDIGSQPTYSEESGINSSSNFLESTPEPKEDSDKSVAMVTGESEVMTDSVSMTTKDMMVDGAMGEKATKPPMGSETTKESHMTTSSEEMGSIVTVSSGMKPMSNASKDMQPMATDSSVIKSMATDSTANQPLATENSETDMSNEIDSMNPEEKSTKKPKRIRPKPTSKKFKKCQEKMSVCNRYFTEQVRPAEENQDMEAKCQAAAEYSMCVDEFVDKCKNEIKANAINTIIYTRDRLTSSCRDDVGVVHTDLGPYESCNELQMCTRHLTEGDSIFDNVHSACNSLTSMLMCGDSALSKCSIENSANGDTSLSTVGEWYSKYCNKVIMERTSFVTCESLRPCNTPFNASTSVKDMYDVNKWCQYTHSVIICTNNALDNCESEDREAIESDLRMLQAEASDICPRPGASEEVIDIGTSKGNDGSGASTVFSTSSIFLSCVHVVLVFVLSLR
ncbi:hypothetical protein LOTGIDRAFT_236713 [Lottia gigantea]|uniref:Ig-like domain-containing protein n=1 Tax=Lottia gigantea TaxID=225164 RepID=V3YYP0_LOTGI|nr:hypothetical protein LOTGIDRAFT_236713 [Lottia gigantea]ESO83263.1 hypothetical protein LOTGIDRAFT_236713 [Lottia gigantea]